MFCLPKTAWPPTWLVGPVPRNGRCKFPGDEAGFTGSSGGVRAPSVTRSRNSAARSDEKPLRAESSSSGWFRAWVNRSYPEGKRLLLCTGTGRATLAFPRERNLPNEMRPTA